MAAYKISVEVGGRNLESVVKEGVLATIETGIHRDGVERPEHKVVIMVGPSSKGVSAWVQVAHFNGTAHPQIAYEGWIATSSDRLMAVAGTSHIAASIVEERSPSDEVRSCHEGVEFGILSCCTSSGSGCYVKCCNGCCSDPVGCPGASCCG